MAIYSAFFGSRMRWRFSLNAPKAIRLKSIPKYSLLHPYYFSKEYEDKRLFFGDSRSVLKENAIFNTNGFILRGDFNKLEEVRDVYSRVDEFIRYLRFECLQGEIQAHQPFHWISTYPKIKSGISGFSELNGMATPSYYYHTEITLESIKKADNSLAKGQSIPIYEEVILDAQKSLLQHEYNKTILFSVIAIESLLAHNYTKIYNAEVNRERKKRELRILRHHDGRYYDPVFKMLNDGTNFLKLLHEIPLYLINRSILLENQQLYNTLRKLYTTRNKIVHWGAPLKIEDNILFEVNKASAAIAVKSANEVFKWVGIDRFDMALNPSEKYVHIH